MILSISSSPIFNAADEFRYFGDEEDLVDDELAPQEAGSQFQFGGQWNGQTQQGGFNFGS